MTNRTAVITFWIIIVVGYAWALVQLAAKEPFDAMVLFLVTWSFQSYRREVQRLIKEKDNG